MKMVKTLQQIIEEFLIDYYMESELKSKIFNTALYIRLSREDGDNLES